MNLPRAWWFLRTLRGSRCQDGLSLERIQAGSAGHLTREAIDLPLSLPAAPWHCECRPNQSAARGEIVAPTEMPLARSRVCFHNRVTYCQTSNIITKAKFCLSD